VGDFGGGSLELVDVFGPKVGKGITLPLGGIRLSEHAEGSVVKARSHVRKYMKQCAGSAEHQRPHLLCSRRHLALLAKLHMELRNYPLHMMQGYEISFDEAMAFLTEVIEPRI
jgi:exopolyphosphatase/guanosine-5'-triphosphate,3'-diphosphate pyrophosphatase